MNTINLKNICEQVCELAKETGSFVLNEQKNLNASNIIAKGKNDFLTFVDKASEERLIKGLSHILPQASFIAEEGTVIFEQKEFTWVIDPIDGTTNFIHGLPAFCISIALMQNNKVVMGVVYELNSKECFYSYLDAPAFLNDTIISVSQSNTLSSSLIATGFPYTFSDKLDNYIDLLKNFVKKTHGLRRIGSAALDLAYVACGRFDGYYEYNLKHWDIAAGAFILQQAGGKVTDFKGEDDYFYGKEVVASNGFIHQEFQSEIEKFMGN